MRKDTQQIRVNGSVDAPNPRMQNETEYMDKEYY